MRSRFCRRSSLLAFGAILAASAAQLSVAHASTSGIEAYQPTISARVGTLGIGPEISIRIPHSNFGLRGNVNIFSYSRDNLFSHNFHSYNGVSGYNVDAQFGGALRLFNGGLTGDYYPFGSGFRLSVGVYGNGNRITGLATPAGSLIVGGSTYTAAHAGSISAKALTNKVAPYVGFGYAGRVVSNLVFSVDAGVLVEGNPRMYTAVNGPMASVPAFTRDLESERVKVQHDARIPVYPVIQLGLGWRF